MFRVGEGVGWLDAEMEAGDGVGVLIAVKTLRALFCFFFPSPVFVFVTTERH